ncbi:MAG: 16S rRNA (guanine(527)-N(7))-methyltransferase RsmG [Betaproteobacteria bacterium]|nr:16S rRNA (guanine(527)-N(7))-methyltransferase RsmG [Betaproteobacteria bacterium]
MIAVTPNLRTLMDDGLFHMGLDLDEGRREQMLHYVELLGKWNKVYNLTAVREPERMLGLHILDSLSVHSHVAHCKTIIDVGTGAGLPGLVLAIANPDIKFSLLDTIAKKTTFVRQAIGELGLDNAVTLTERVENYRPASGFDGVISRAFAELKDFVEGAAHLCNANGRLFAMKGVYPHDEIARLPAGFKVEQVIPLAVPSVEGQRHLVVIRKT